MGFKNLTYHQEIISSLSSDAHSRITQSFTQLYNGDKKPTIVTFYNVNKEQTTLDPSLHIHYSDLGNLSSLRFTKYNNLYLFGISRVELDAAYGDFGVEAAEITGTAFLMPNLFDPYVNAYFSINYLDRDLLFKIISVTPDTLYNGSNWWKLEYKLDQHKWEEGTIDDKVVKVINFKVENYGTEYNCLLEEQKSEEFDDTLNTITELEQYFKNIFYDENVQTFAFYNLDEEFESPFVLDLASARFYDSFMIEFIRRNNLLKDIDFLYIDHRTILSDQFIVEYDHSVFKAIETGRLDQVKKFNNPFCGVAVEEPTSLLSQFSQTYYQATYSKYERMNCIRSFYIFNTDMMDRISNDKLYEEDEKLIYNVIINYFNGRATSIKDLKIALERMDYINNFNNFYLIPFVIFIMNKDLIVSSNEDS